MLNAAIVGLGWWGKTLVEAAKDSPLLRFTRAVTLEPETAKDFAARHGLSIGTSYEDLLADRTIDAVVLATPHTRHRCQVEAAAAAGKHVFCEKPITLSRADALAAIGACRRAGVALGVGHNRRLWPSIRAIRELCNKGTFGTVMHVEGNYSHDWLAAHPASHWRSAPEEARAGGMTGMGIHLLDCFSYLVGPMHRISALSMRRTLPLSTGDTTASIIEFGGGATGTIATTLKTPYIWRLAIYGSEAWAESTSETQLKVCQASREPEKIELQPTNHICENLESFASAALGMGHFHIADQDIVHTVAALEAVFLSAAEQGSWIEVSSFDEAIYNGSDADQETPRSNSSLTQDQTGTMAA